MMRRTSSKLVTLLTALWSLFLFIFAADAQTDNLNIGINESTVASGREPISDSSAGFGIPYSAILRDPTFSSPVPLTPLRGTAQDISNIGPNGGLKLQTGFNERSSLSLPFRGGRSGKSHFKIGAFSLRLDSISATVLASDNVNHSTTSHEFGAIAIIRTGVVGQMQITDNFTLDASLRVFYLPFVNRGGIAGFGFDDPLGDFDFSPLGGAQLAYNGLVGHWDLRVYDDFRMSAVRLGANLAFPVEYGFSSPHEEDRAGRYVFASGSDVPPSAGSKFRDGSIESVFLSIGNTVGFIMSREIPTETYISFGGDHTTSWHDDNDGLAPHSRDVLFATAESVRENMRFKPKLQYSQSRSDLSPGWAHRIEGTIHGPIDENISISGGAGYFWRDDRDASTLTYEGKINHVIGPLTREYFSAVQVVTEPIEEKVESYSYRIQQILGPDLVGSVYASYSKFSSLQPGVYSSTEKRLGTYLDWRVSPITQMRFSANYTKVQSENPTRDEYTTWRAQVDVFEHRWATVLINLTCRYEWSENSRVAGSYSETLLVLTVTKTF